MAMAKAKAHKCASCRIFFLPYETPKENVPQLPTDDGPVGLVVVAYMGPFRIGAAFCDLCPDCFFKAVVAFLLAIPGVIQQQADIRDVLKGYFAGVPNNPALAVCLDGGS